MDDEGFVKFLHRAIQPALDLLSPNIQCLDYGCGPEPVLSQILYRDHQLSCENFDPYFFPDLPSKKYGFIFSTETFEHFFQPQQEILKLRALMRPQAYLCVMTNFYSSLSAFENWWYRRDMTHVTFYHQHTFDYIAASFGFNLIYSDQKQVVILQKT